MLNEWFKKITGRRDTSSQAAKKRLQFALVYDKLEMTEDTLARLQADIVAVVSKYFVIDQANLKLDIRHQGETSALVMNTPIRSARITRRQRPQQQQSKPARAAARR
ncbi:MAG: cell division topological specificity factor MinE [Proteobacteria bacterium]|nr:cell division topological specificity factor MinE [Pseudomonadota bacterium]